MFSWMSEEAICAECGATNKIKLDSEKNRVEVLKDSKCVCGGELL